MRNSTKTGKIDQKDFDKQVSEDFIKVKSFYLRNRLKLNEETLAWMLPLLENKLEAGHSEDQYDSFYLFAKLCFNYRKKLPDNYSHFKNNPHNLIQLFEALKQSNWFDETIMDEAFFINKALTTLAIPSETKQLTRQ